MATSYANTGGTGNRNAIIACVANQGVSGGQIDNLVDGGFGANGSDAIAFINARSDYIIYFDFRSTAHLQIIDEFKWYQNTAGSQGTWKFQGWDGLTWTDLVTGINLGNAVATQTTSFSNTTGYHIYRLVQTGGSTNSGPLPLEIEFKIEQGAASSAPTTSYSNSGGSGDRRATIPAISTDATVTAGTLNLLIDGSTFQSTPVATAAGATWIAWDFGTAQIIDQIRYWASNNADAGLFQFQGSTDNATWVELGLPRRIFGPAGGGSVIWDDLQYNKKGYRYYRVKRIDTNTGLIPNTFEWDFRLAADIVASGILDATEAPDVADFAGHIDPIGTLAATEAADVAAFSGFLSDHYGTLATTEAGDVADFSGYVPTSLALAATEAPDVVAIAANVPASAVLNTTEAPDVAAMTGHVTQVLAVSEAPDLAAFTGLLRKPRGPVTIIQTN